LTSSAARSLPSWGQMALGKPRVSKSSKDSCAETVRRDRVGRRPGQRMNNAGYARGSASASELAVESFSPFAKFLERNAGFYPAPRPVDEVIELVGLREKADDKIKKLSGASNAGSTSARDHWQPELLFLDERQQAGPGGPAHDVGV